MDFDSPELKQQKKHRSNKRFSVNINEKTPRLSDRVQNVRKRISLDKGSSICGQKYMLSHKIGQGSFGQVFIGIKSQQQTNAVDSQVAIKIQSQLNNKTPQLANESQCLKSFQANGVVQGFPQYFSSGCEGRNTYLVMQLLGPNLQDLMTICNGKFSVKTTVLLGIQIFQRIQYIHSKDYIYRDIKPQNFVLGLGYNSSMLYIIDFGLCKKYRDKKTELNYPYREDRQLTGTIRYSSVNSHLGIQQARRDDLEAICYMLIYFLKGKLPWQGNKAQAKIQKQHVIQQMKLKISTSELCEDLPFQISNITSYCRELGYHQDPDYDFIYGELASLFKRMKFSEDFDYDWVCQSDFRSLQTNFLSIRFNSMDKEPNDDSVIKEQIQDSILHQQLSSQLDRDELLE